MYARLFPAFESHGYRWLWASAAFRSLAMGTVMLAQGWLVLTITDSPFWVGLVTGVQGLGLVLFGALGGTVSDRLDRRRALVLAQWGSGAIALIVGALVLFEQISLWKLVIAAFLQGGFMAVQLPASNSLTYSAVGPQKLMNALAGLMLAMSSGMMVGSVMGGELISALGIGSCYFLGALGAFVGGALVLPVRGGFIAPLRRQSFFKAMSEGLAYAWADRRVRALLVLSLLMESFGFSHFVMMPVIARDVLHVGPSGLGYLSAASSAGSVASTLVIARLGNYSRKGRLLAITAGLSAGSLLLYAFSSWFGLSLALIAMLGASLMAYDVTMGTTLQSVSSDAMRGRVLGLYGLTFGFTPVGGFLAGSIASVATAPLALGVFGGLIAAYLLVNLRSIERVSAAQGVPAGSTAVPGSPPVT